MICKGVVATNKGMRKGWTTQLLDAHHALLVAHLVGYGPRKDRAIRRLAVAWSARSVARTKQTKLVSHVSGFHAC